jgi:hypothetical protein
MSAWVATTCRRWHGSGSRGCPVDQQRISRTPSFTRPTPTTHARTLPRPWVEAVFDDLLIDWVALEPNAPGVDKSIAELEIHRTTGVSIIATIRGDQAPEPSEILRAGDRLVIVSRRQDIGPFRDLIVG